MKFCSALYPLNNPIGVVGAYNREMRKRLPDWDWYDISAHLKCTKCGTAGYVDTRLNWGEVINFNKGVC